MSGGKTEAKMVNEAKHTEVCLHHLESGQLSNENSVITNSGPVYTIPFSYENGMKIFVL